MADQRLEVLVLDHHICHAVFQLLNQPEQLSDVKGLGGEGLSAAGVAVAEKLQEHGRSAHIVILGNPHTDFLQLRCLERGKHDFREHQFLRQKPVIECLMIEELADRNEVLSGVEIAEAQLTDRRHRPFLHTSEQVDQVAVEIVVDFEGVNGRFAKKDASAAAEHVDKASVVQRKQSVENVQDRSLVSYT